MHTLDLFQLTGQLVTNWAHTLDLFQPICRQLATNWAHTLDLSQPRQAACDKLGAHA